MIREVLPDFLALSVFMTGGGLCAILFLKRSILPLTKQWGLVLDFLLGILVGVTYVLLTEVFFVSVITPYTVLCFIVGFSGIFIFFKESTPRKKKPRKPKKQRLAKKQASSSSNQLVSFKPYSCYRNHRFSFPPCRHRK